MSSPTLKVEIAFASDPYDTTPTWTNVSQYVRSTPGVVVNRGRSPGSDQFDPGYCRLTLSNRDRRFDPSYAAGPNFGNLLPRKQIRVTATWSAVDYVMFTGWVTGWPQDFLSPHGLDATVTIEAFDALALLTNNDLPNDYVYGYASTTVGSLALFLRNADVERWSDATSNGYYATPFVGTARFFEEMPGRFAYWEYSLSGGGGQSAASLAPGMASTAVSLDGLTLWQVGQPYTPASNWSMSFWVQLSGNTSSVYVIGGDNPSVSTGIYVNTSGNIGVVYVGAGTTFTVSPVNNGISHHVVVTAHATNGVTVYVDGVVSSTAPASFHAFKFAAIGAQAPVAGLPMFTGSIQDVAAFDKALSAAEVVALYDFSRGYLEETSTARITRLLDAVDWPATWRDLTTAPRAIVGQLTANAVGVLGKLAEVVRSEQGRFFAAKDGDITFLSRYYTSEVTAGSTVQQIFSDDGGATALPYSTFGFQYHDIDVTNNVTVTTPTTWAAASDSTSEILYGPQSKRVDTILTTFQAADAMARGLVAQGKNPTWRAAPILVYPERNTTRWDELLGLELGHRAGIEITPMKVGAQNAREVTIEQFEWNIEGTTWSVTIAGSPCFGGASGATPGWFIVGQSIVGGPDVIGY